MSWSKLIMRLGAAVAAASLGLPAVAQKADTSLLNYDGPDRMKKIVQAAKKEGSLMLYTSLVEKNLQRLIDPFEKKYGVKINVWRAGQTRLLQRVVTEAKAGRFEVDALHFGSPELEALHREKLLAPVQSPVLAELREGMVPEHREWAPTILQVYVQAYNTNLVKKKDLPKSYEDLLDPKWKGKLGIEAKAWPWYATLVGSMGEEKGVKLFRDIANQSEISVRQGTSLLNNMVAAGEVPLALTIYSHMPLAAKRKGAPVDSFSIEPTIARANGVAIAKHAKHPNAALLFYEYMLSSTEGQKIFASMDYVPTNTKVPSPLPPGMKLKLVEATTVLDEVGKWNKLFDETFVKKDAP